MKSLFALFCHFLFWQRIMTWVFSLGILLIAGGISLYIMDGAENLQTVLVVIGLLLALIFPVMFSAMVFRILISNSRLTLLPHLRVKAGLALLILVVIASIALPFALSYTKDGAHWHYAVSCFATMSLYILVAQWWLGQRWGAGLLWLYFVISLQALNLPSVKSFLADPSFTFLLGVTAITAWMVTFRWLRKARTISRLQMNLVLSNNPGGPSQPQMQVPTHFLRFGFSGTQSAPASILIGGYYNLKNRLLLLVFMYLAFPAMMLLVQVLPAFFKGEPIRDVMLSPVSLLAMGLYGGAMAGFFGREWLARLRLLWLRHPGSRAQLWRYLEKVIWRDILLAAIVGVSYAGMIWLFTELTALYAVTFVILGTGLLLFSIYLSLYLQIRLFSMGSQAALMLLALIVVGGTILFSFLSDTTWLVPALMLVLTAATLWIRSSMRQLVHGVDWCQIKPMQISRLGMASSHCRR